MSVVAVKNSSRDHVPSSSSFAAKAPGFDTLAPIVSEQKIVYREERNPQSLSTLAYEIALPLCPSSVPSVDDSPNVAVDDGVPQLGITR